MVKRTWVLNAKWTSHPNKVPFISVSAILSNFQKSVKSVDLTPISCFTGSRFLPAYLRRSGMRLR